MEYALSEQTSTSWEPCLTRYTKWLEASKTPRCVWKSRGNAARYKVQGASRYCCSQQFFFSRDGPHQRRHHKAAIAGGRSDLLDLRDLTTQWNYCFQEQLRVRYDIRREQHAKDFNCRGHGGSVHGSRKYPWSRHDRAPYFYETREHVLRRFGLRSTFVGFWRFDQSEVLQFRYGHG